LLNVQALTGNTDNGVGKVRHVQHLDDFFDIVVLLLLANMFGLTQHGRKLKRLANSGCLKMEIPGVVSMVWYTLSIKLTAAARNQWTVGMRGQEAFR
jgi:hypothetical protein